MITLVCGPAGSGKTTYVRKNMRPGDLVIDLDYLYSALSLQPTHDHPKSLAPYVKVAYDAVMVRLEIEQRKGSNPNAWIIAGLPEGFRRKELARRMNADVVLLDVQYDECIRRISQDEARQAQSVEYWHQIVARWWSVYSE